MSSGIVMNGPTPIMLVMFSAVAWQQAEAALERRSALAGRRGRRRHRRDYTGLRSVMHGGDRRAADLLACRTWLDAGQGGE